MTVDESSSQDATLIDDDLVAALGFEPVTTIETSNGHQADDGIESDERDGAGGFGEVNGFGVDALDAAELDGDVVELDVDVDERLGDHEDEGHMNGDVAVDETALDETALDDEIDETVDEITVIDDDDGDAVDVDAAELDAAELDVAEESVPRASFFDLDTSVDEATGVDVDDIDDEALAHDHVDDLGVDDVEPADLAIDALVADAGEETAVDVIVLDRLDADPADLDDADLDSVDLDSVDLDSDELADLETSDGSEQGLDLDLDSDLDTDALDSDLDDELVALADADSVFAEVEVGDRIDLDHEATENLLVVDDGPVIGTTTTVDETVGAGAVAVATGATELAPSNRRRRLRARKSRRVIRHIDPWSVLTFSVLFHMVVFAALLLASVLVWNAAIESGMVENVESFIQELGDYETFEINADVMFKAAVVIAGMLTLASSVLVVLLTVVFNLISDLVGGIRVTVIEEETVRVPIDKKRASSSD